MAGINALGGASAGEVYELKPGEMLTLYSTPTYVAEASTAFLQATFYTNLLNLLVPVVPWSLGTTFLAGIRVWPAFTTAVIPGWTLVTFSDYALVPGALLYDFVPSPVAFAAEALVGVSAAAAAVFLNHLVSYSALGAAADAGIGAVVGEDIIRMRPPARAVVYTGLRAASITIGAIGLGFAAGSA